MLELRENTGQYQKVSGAWAKLHQSRSIEKNEKWPPMLGGHRWQTIASR
jgi:hypothetical protein